MDTAQATFEVDRTIARDRKWRQSRDMKWHQSRSPSGSMFCATGSGAISALEGAFLTGSDKVTWRGLVRKYVLRMRNRNLCHIYPSGTFLTGSDVSHVSRSGSDRK
jgi:hypothetical protein